MNGRRVNLKKKLSLRKAHKAAARHKEQQETSPSPRSKPHSPERQP